MTIPSDSPTAFFVCTFSMLGKLAAADGVVSPEEVRKVEEYINKTLKLDKKKKKLALGIFRDSFDSPLSMRDYAIQFHKSYPDRVQLLDRMIEILVELSVSDGRLSPREDEMIRSAALLLDLSEPHYERIKSKFVSASSRSH